MRSISVMASSDLAGGACGACRYIVGGRVVDYTREGFLL